MNKFNIFTVLLIAVTTAAVLFSPLSSALDEPVTKTRSALLVEINSGIVLYQKNKDYKIEPGGAAKAMTLLLAVEAIETGQASLLDKVTPSETFMNNLGEGDTVLGIKPDETMKLEDLLYSAYISAGCDACNIVAEHLAGDMDTFVARMNLKAKQLGCTRTHFVNPCGCNDLQHFTTPWDQYLIFKEAVEYPLFLKIAGESTYKVSTTEFSRERTLKNVNPMLDSNSSHYYDKCVAGSYDPSDAAEGNVISYADNGELALITVLFGLPEEPDGTARDLIFSETIRLFECGFGGFKWQIVLDEAVIIAREEVELADGAGVVELKPNRSISALARKELTEEEIVKHVVLYGQGGGGNLTAPIGEGALLGEVTVIIEGIARGKAGLVAAHEVGLNERQYMKNQLFMTLGNPWVQVCIGALVLLIIGYIFLVIRDIKKRRERRHVIEETKRKLIEDRKKREKLYR